MEKMISRKTQQFPTTSLIMFPALPQNKRVEWNIIVVCFWVSLKLWFTRTSRCSFDVAQNLFPCFDHELQSPEHGKPSHPIRCRKLIWLRFLLSLFCPKNEITYFIVLIAEFHKVEWRTYNKFNIMEIIFWNCPWPSNAGDDNDDDKQEACGPRLLQTRSRICACLAPPPQDKWKRPMKLRKSHLGLGRGGRRPTYSGK